MIRCRHFFGGEGWTLPGGYRAMDLCGKWKMEKQKSDFERTLGWKQKLTSSENFSLDVDYNIGMDIFPRFWKLLAIKTQFVSWRCRRDSLDFHPFNSRLMMLFSFWIPFHAPPPRRFFVCFFWQRFLAEELKTNWSLVHSFRSQEDALRFIFQCQAFQYRPSGPEDFPRFQNREVRFLFERVVISLPLQLWPFGVGA